VRSKAAKLAMWWETELWCWQKTVRSVKQLVTMSNIVVGQGMYLKAIIVCFDLGVLCIWMGSMGCG